jgi:predicted XRE-type DNA-binding protein
MGMARTDVNRILNADLARFTIDRLVTVLTKLDPTVKIVLTSTAQPAETPAEHVAV